MTPTATRLDPFAWSVRLLVGSTVFLLFAGALVTTTGSGLAVPDWPLSFGTWFPRMTGGVFYEHGHRMVASAVGLFTLVVAVWSSLSQQPRSVRRLAWLALALVILQGLLGGLTVLLRLPPMVSVAHGTLAQLFLCCLIALWLHTSPAYRKANEPAVEGDTALALRTIGVVAFLAVFCQLLLGATMRHMGAGLVIGDFPLNNGQLVPNHLENPYIAVNFSHRMMGWLVFCTLIYYAVTLYRYRHRLPQVLPRLGFLLVALVCIQITLGAFTVWTARGVVPTSLHVVNGALVLATTFASMLWIFRATGRSVTFAQQPGEAPPATEDAPAPVNTARKDWMELFKVRLVAMAAFTAGSAYWLGAGSEASWTRLFEVVLGTMLMGSGGGVLNQLLEVEADSQMRRTRNRPLVAGRIDTVRAELVGALLSLGGILYLGVIVHPLAGILAALALVSYVFVYTPLKRTTPHCTVVGAIPGALPVLVGWASATGGLELGGWILFFILFLWQLPHFMAIAWLCREDYARAGFPMVTVVDPSGRLATCQALAYTLALLPVSLAPSLCGMAGTGYFFVALALGLVYLYAGLHLGLRPAPAQARRLLLASVIYLPLLYSALLLS